MYIHKFICHQRAIPKEHTLTKRADELELELLSKRAQDEPELELELRAIQAMPSCTARLPTSLRMLKKYVSFLRILGAG